MIFVLPLTFLLTSVYYPNVISEFFINHSDKLRLLKGSDLFMAYAIYCLLYFERIKNNNFIYIFTFILSGALIPLIVFSSRGASIGTLIVLVYFIYKNRRALVRSKILFIGSSLIFLIVLTLSSIYLDWTKIDFEEINTEVALESLEMTLVSKRYPETVKPTFYIEDNRLNSGDGNLNWRLQIWQDVSSDLYKKNKLISGYGFKGAIPAMEEGGRSGLDGTNIHVHNYFVNILARGGVIHLLLFIIFYAILITKFLNKENGKGVAAFIVSVLFVSFFDSSMESVRFPFLFYIILSYKLKKE
jgi:O-antigen ligase